MSVKEQNDAYLVAAVKGGDQDAFREIVLRYQKTVFASAVAVTCNRTDAEDVTQEVFLRFFKYIEQFDPERPLAPYLRRIAVNHARNTLRKRVDIPMENIYAVADSQVGADSGELEDLADRAARIRQLVCELPSTLREVCSLFYFSGHTCAEVGAILEMTESAVKVALHRARKKLLTAFLTEQEGS